MKFINSKSSEATELTLAQKITSRMTDEDWRKIQEEVGRKLSTKQDSHWTDAMNRLNKSQTTNMESRKSEGFFTPTTDKEVFRQLLIEGGYAQQELQDLFKTKNPNSRKLKL